MSVVEQLAEIVGVDYVLTGDAAAPYLTDWRGIFTGRAHCVVRPSSTREVAGIVRYCAKHRISIVTQGGNTGLVGGATPSDDGNSIVLSTARLNRIREINTVNDTVTVEAGCILQTLQERCAEHVRLFPLSLAAEGSCTIGGNLATNAGGSQVLRYGNMRELTLGLEVVTAGGDIWNGLHSLRKDNTGYDLKSLMVGSEGTLGIITAAVLRLFPLPRTQVAALVAADNLAACVSLLQRFRAAADDSLSAFEVMAGSCLSLVTTQFPEQRLPFKGPPRGSAWFALIELSTTEDENSTHERLTTVLADALEAGEITDAVVAASLAQNRQFWHLRESITLAQAKAGKGIKHDISLPVSAVSEFVESTGKALADAFPGLAVMPFGHLGDGNLHYNVNATLEFADAEVERMQDRIYALVHDAVHTRGGSISAEHGIGQLKREELARYKQPVALAMMRAVKQALDSHGIFNPGKVVLQD